MKTKICIPIIGQDEKEVLDQTEKILQMQPDLIEWRADYIEKLDTDVIENITAKLKILLEMSNLFLHLELLMKVVSRV